LQDWQALEAGEQVRRTHTGWDNVDKRLKGLRGGELVILAGTTGTGKTVAAMQIATHNALQGSRALVFSLEMSRRELYRRMVGQVGRIPVFLADSDNPEDRENFYAHHSTALSVAVGKLKGIAMDVDDQGALHINQIASRARRAHRKSPLSLIVVDYLQLVRGDGQSREREVASVSAGLKALAKELDVPVIALSQFNREAGKGGKPSMSQLRDSGSLEQDADIVILLWREDKDSDNPANPGLVHVITAKHRRGEPGTEFLKAKLAHFRMDVWTAAVHEPKPEPKFRQFQG
jgi:replicative DNA helicase